MATQYWRPLAPFNSTVGLGCRALNVVGCVLLHAQLAERHSHRWAYDSLLVVWNKVDPFCRTIQDSNPATAYFVTHPRWTVQRYGGKDVVALLGVAISMVT